MKKLLILVAIISGTVYAVSLVLLGFMCFGKWRSLFKLLRRR